MGDGNNIFSIKSFILSNDMPVWHNKTVTNEYLPKGTGVWCIDANGARFTYCYFSREAAEFVLGKFASDRVTTVELFVNFSKRNPVFVSRLPWETWSAMTRK